MTPKGIFALGSAVYSHSQLTNHATKVYIAAYLAVIFWNISEGN